MGIIGCCPIRQSHYRTGHTNRRSLTACIFRNWLAFCGGGVYPLFVVRLMRGLTGHEAVNGYHKNLTGWNRKAMRMTLPAQPSQAQVSATEQLCALAAAEWTTVPE